MSDTYGGRTIKKFQVDGVARDQEDIIRLRTQLESHMIDDMRVKGYVPVLDITPELFWNYEKEDQNFKYLLIVYGSYVGKRKSRDILGLLGSHPIFVEPHKGDASNQS